MAVEFSCPACGGVLRVGEGPIGRLVRCGGCLVLLKVPDAPPVDPAGVPPAQSELLPVAYPVGSEPPEPAPFTVSPPSHTHHDEADGTPARKGMTFWLSVTLLALGLGTCGCCGLAAVILPDPHWQEHESDKGGFKVQLPEEPQDDLATRPGLRLNRQETIEGTHLWTRAENYSVAYWDVEPTRQRADKNGKTDEQLITEVINQLAGKAKGERPKSLTEADFPGGLGFPAAEFEYRYGNRGVITARVVVADSRVYLLRAGGKFTDPGSENVRYFLKSFEITDEKLVAESRNRKARGKAKD